MAAEIRTLARFRHAIRKFLHFSEQAVRKAGLTPQQHQLLLGVAGFTGEESATIGDLAEFLQVRHHSAVGLVDRAEAAGLVRREVPADDQRVVRVVLTADGARKLRALGPLHRKELAGMRRIVDIYRLERDNSTQAKASARSGKPRRSG